MATITVSNGDDIDQALDGDLTGDTVRIEPGSYWRSREWNTTLSGTTIEGDGGRVVINSGDGHSKGADWDCRNDSTIRDITFAGTFGAKGSGSFTAARASGGATLTFENCRWPDGSASIDDPAHAVYVRPSHDGAMLFRNCMVRGFADNGIYGSAMGASGGTVSAEGCEFYHNNIASFRIGGSGSYVRNCYFETDNAQTPDRGGAENARGVWIHESGDYVVENNEFVFNTSRGVPINGKYRDAAGASVAVRNNLIQQDGSDRAMYFDQANASGSGNHITGSGNLSTPGADHTVACRGSGCRSPGDGVSDPVVGENSVRINTSSSAGSLAYSFETTGQIYHASEAEPTSDSITQLSNGNWRASGTAGSGFPDSYTADGSLVNWDIPTGATLLWNGTEPDAEPTISDTFQGEPKSAYHYCGTQTGLFEAWQNLEITTSKFQTRTDPGQGTAAVQLEPCDTTGPVEGGTPLLALGLLGAAAAAAIRQRRS